MNSMQIFDQWFRQNQRKIDFMFGATRSDVVRLFAKYAAKNHKELGIKKNIDALANLIKDVCGFYSGTPERTYKAVVDHFGFVWPSLDGDSIDFGVSRVQHYFNVSHATILSDLHSHVYTREIEGKSADAYWEAKQKGEEVVKYLEYETMEAYYDKALITLIKPCFRCGELVPVSDRNFGLKRFLDVECGQCQESSNTIKELKKQKAQLNKLTKQLKESIKNENE
jgi:hypothetical protein